MEKKRNRRKGNVIKDVLSQRKDKKERENRRKRHIRDMKGAERQRVSYIKKPLARSSMMSIGLAGMGLLLCGWGILSSVMSQGQAELRAAAIGFCSMLVSGAAVLYGVLSLKEQDKNYLLAKIGTGMGSFLVLVWIVIIIIGMRG